MGTVECYMEALQVLVLLPEAYQIVVCSRNTISLLWWITRTDWMVESVSISGLCYDMQGVAGGLYDRVNLLRQDLTRVNSRPELQPQSCERHVNERSNKQFQALPPSPDRHPRQVFEKVWKPSIAVARCNIACWPRSQRKRSYIAQEAYPPRRPYHHLPWREEEEASFVGWMLWWLDA